MSDHCDESRPDEPPAYAITYRKHRCPHCGSPRTRVYCVRSGIRYHRCHDCTYRFKSVEEGTTE